MVLFIIILIVLSCYVGSSDIPDETKTSYFIVTGVILLLVIITRFF